MSDWGRIISAYVERGTVAVAGADPPRVARYGNLRDEYAALCGGPGLVDRNVRALLEITGADRAAWLHNLTTNEVKNLSPGEGCFAFSLNVQGRILFDLNVLVRADSLWLDLDRRWVDRAQAHLDKYTITEDVRVTDRSVEFVRLALTGDAARKPLSEVGAGHAMNMEWYGTTEVAWQDAAVTIVRNDFCGVRAVELFVPSGVAADLWRWLTDEARSTRAVPVGDEAVEVRRIEAGVPAPGHEIAEEYLPAETGQFERAVSYRKGCYLGQEVVERMRSRGVVARKLVGLRVEGERIPPAGATLQDEAGKAIGSVTSACHSLGVDGVIALGYVRTAAAGAGTPITIVHDEGTTAAAVAALPFIAGTEA